MNKLDINETQLQWCTRTFDYADDDFGPVVRWVIEGRGAAYERYKPIASVRRHETVEQTIECIMKEIASAEVRQARVKAWQKGAKNQVSQKSWEVFVEAEGDDSEAYEMTPMGMHVAERAQTLRHNQFLMRYATGASETIIRILSERLQKAEERANNAAERELEAHRVVQEFQDRKLDREIRVMRETSINHGLTAAAGIIKHKMLGTVPSQGEARAETDRSALDLFHSLTPDQAEHMLAVLRPDQRMALSMLLDDSGSAEHERGVANEDPADPSDTSLASSQVSPILLETLKSVLSSEAYACALQLLSEDRGLASNPQRLVALVGEVLGSMAREGKSDDAEK